MGGQRRVAVVTGSNKGIGYAIVRGLCKQFDGDVYLTARNESLGLQAVKDLKKEGLNPQFHQLDVTKPDTIVKMRSFLKHTYGGLDLLVNNAGIIFDINSPTEAGDQAESLMKTNFTGLCNVSEVLFPLLRPHARVVNVSSMISVAALFKCSNELQQKFTDQNISSGELKRLMQQFVDCVHAGTHGDCGWPTGKLTSGYGVSKIGATVMSFIQQREFLRDSRPDIVVNACCPGYVKTDLTGQLGTKTTDQGAETPLYLALLSQNTATPKGQLVSEKQIVSWEAKQSKL
ncbi:carbonyl reductase [NADPH] 1-like [Ylistrum balloti]|uniref:carbonyl reductase [NADPH] 1-like n=1 Tax=Ylistrum balloti TaxID=509963 RepID=UPI002905CB28|nr:carbonyl reductase [NADPH] 1-like [Ylistrum balloti]